MAYRDLQRKAAARKAWAVANPEKIREYARRDYARRKTKDTPESRAKRVAYHKAYHAKYGFSRRTAARRESVPGPCEVCGLVGRLNQDHSHDTGKLRGLLCLHCNSALGFARDSVVHLESLVAYLRRWES